MSSNLSTAGKAVMDVGITNIKTSREFIPFGNFGASKIAKKQNAIVPGIDIGHLANHSKDKLANLDRPKKQGRMFELNLGQNVSIILI